MNQMADILASELHEHQISAATAAAMTNYSQSAFSNYLNKKRQIPKDLIATIADKLNSARLKVLHGFECGCGLFKTKYLAGVDDHPTTVREICKHELQEAIDALTRDPVENKRSREDFTDEEWQRHMTATLHLADLHAAIEKRLESDLKYFGQDPKEIETEINRKLDAKGYTKEKSPKKAIM